MKQCWSVLMVVLIAVLSLSSCAQLPTPTPTPDPTATPTPTGGYTLPKYGISLSFTSLLRDATSRAYELDQCKAVGAQYVRVALRPTVIDQFNLMRQDAEARGMQVMACMFDSGYVDPSTAQSYAQQWASQWKDIRMWEFTNEPNAAGTGWTAATYAQSLAAAYAGLKAGNPDAIMIAGALATAIDKVTCVVNWVSGLYAAGAKGHFDVFSVHLYDDPDIRADWNLWDWTFYPSSYNNYTTVRSIMDSKGDQAIPIISTEAGLPVHSSDAPDFHYYNETNQAVVIGHDFDHLASGQIASFAIYTMMDDDVPGFSLLRADLSQRPAWGVYQERALNFP